MGKRMAVVVGLAVAGAQAGHLLTYRVRFGAVAMQVQSSGAHAYFPAVVKTSLGVAALTLMAGLLVVGAARVVSAGNGARTAGGPPFLSLLAAMFTFQLAWFMGQETAEALFAGVPPEPASNLLLWGMVGQLPVALAGALALRWLWMRIEAAAVELASVTRAVLPPPAPAPVLVTVVRDSELALVRAHAAHAPFVKRGPPPSFRFRAF